MTLVDVLTWVLRLVGAFYFLFGLLAARQLWFLARITPSMRKFAQVAQQFGEDMGQRNEPAERLARDDLFTPWWLFAGVMIVAAAGAAMMFAHWLAAPLLAAAIVHQMANFVRQRRRQRAAVTPAEAADARIDQTAINAFFVLLVMAVLTGWLYHEGALT